MGYVKGKLSPTCGDRLDYVVERLTEEPDAMDSTFQPICDDIPCSETSARKERNFQTNSGKGGPFDDMALIENSAGNEKAEAASETFVVRENDIERLNSVEGCERSGLQRDNGKEMFSDNTPLRECCARKKNVEENFIVQENDAHPQALIESDNQTSKIMERSFENMPLSEVNAKEKGFVEQLDGCAESGFQLQNGKERSELQGIGKDFKEEKKRQCWFNSGGDANNAEECNDTNVIMETEDPDKARKTGYAGAYNASSQLVCRPSDETDSVLLIEGIQSACSLVASPSSICPTSVNLFLNSFPTATSASLTTSSWSRHLDINSHDKSAKVATDDFIESRSGGAVQFLRETGSEDIRTVDDGVFTGGEALPILETSFHQPCLVECPRVETYEDYTNLLAPAAANAYTPHNQGFGGIEDSGQEPKITIAEFSLRRVLSDSLTGVFMDDAMVAQCGHSFGVSSLERVLESNLCLSCGTHVPPGSLIPNYALRAAVQAYRREEQIWMSPFKGVKRRREQGDQPENSDGGKRANRAFMGIADSAMTSTCRPKGVQFPFVVNDRVLIKGNKRTPERFVGREAVITTQCLNGWYLVRTLDNGESVRLQYRSLQKLEDTGTCVLVSDIYHGPSGDMTLAMETSKGHSSASAPASISEDVKEEGYSPSNLNDYTCLLGAPSKGLRSECLTKSVRKLRTGVSTIRPPVVTGSSWLSGGTSSNSSQELISAQNEEKLFPPDAVKEQSACAEDASEKAVITREGLPSTETLSIPVDGTENGMESSVFEDGGKQLKQSVKGKDGLEIGSDGRSNTGGNIFTVRSKRSVLHSRSAHLTGSLDLPDADPYKKVYVYSSRRRGGINHMSSAALETKPLLVVAASAKDLQQENDALPDVKYDTSKVSDNLFENMKRAMILLESEIPWTCLRKLWKQSRPAWLKSLQESSTVKDLGTKVREFHDALLLTSPGGMSEEEWEKQLTVALESGKMDLMYFLWEKLQEDVLKWMEAKPKRNAALSTKEKSTELAELHKFFPYLNVEGLSPAGITAATTVAAAEAFADGQLDMEVLLSVPMKLLQKHNHKDLAAVREAIEREKRHIAAKLIQLEAAFSKKNDLSRQSITSNILLENEKIDSTAPVVLALEASTSAIVKNSASAIITGDKDNFTKENFVTVPAKGKDGVGHQDKDGEATDMSDSD